VPNGYPQGQYQQYQPGQYQQGQPGVNGRRSSGLPSFSFDLNRLNVVDRVVTGATLVTMISLWLPWFSASYTALGATSHATISGTGDHGWLWLEFVLALVLIVYLGARAAWDRLPFNLPVAHELLLVGATAVQLLLIVIGFFAKPPTNGVQGLSIGWSFGAFLAVIAALVAVVPAVRSYLSSRKAVGGTQRF
jgi:hypothetical protein